MSAGMYFNKSMEVSADTMRQLRYEGMTNHQIAKACGCSEATVYRYIGKKSLDVMNASITNKPSPVKSESAIQLPVKQELNPAKSKFTSSIKPSATILAKSTETFKKEEPHMESSTPVVKKVNNRKKTAPDVVAKIYEMHDQGMGAWIISKELGIGTSTASRYITRYERSKSPAPAKVPNSSKVKMKLITTAKGELCDYKVDLSSGSIDISGILQGILDKDTIDTVIDELVQIRSIVMG